MDRIRGARPEDNALISPDFIALFARESVPAADPSTYPSASEIRTVFDRVHRQLLGELPRIPDAELDSPLPKPHTVARTKFMALTWCAQHEMVHAGQIGLLRRQLGHEPVW